MSETKLRTKLAESVETAIEHVTVSVIQILNHIEIALGEGNIPANLASYKERLIRGEESVTEVVNYLGGVEHNWRTAPLTGWIRNLISNEIDIPDPTVPNRTVRLDKVLSDDLTKVILNLFATEDPEKTLALFAPEVIWLFPSDDYVDAFGILSKYQSRIKDSINPWVDLIDCSLQLRKLYGV